jgi:hypothetical protein
LLIPGAKVDVKRLFNILKEILGLRRALINAKTL